MSQFPCSFCLKPIEAGETFIQISNANDDKNNPMIIIHGSCGYDIREILNEQLGELENRIN